MKIYDIGEIHPEFNLLAFSGYDKKTGEEHWASMAIDGVAAAFRAFEKNKQFRSVGIHPISGIRDADNLRALASPMSHRHNHPERSSRTP